MIASAGGVRESAGGGGNGAAGGPSSPSGGKFPSIARGGGGVGGALSGAGASIAGYGGGSGAGGAAHRPPLLPTDSGHGGFRAPAIRSSSSAAVASAGFGGGGGAFSRFVTRWFTLAHGLLGCCCFCVPLLLCLLLCLVLLLQLLLLRCAVLLLWLPLSFSHHWRHCCSAGAYSTLGPVSVVCSDKARSRSSLAAAGASGLGGGLVGSHTSLTTVFGSSASIPNPAGRPMASEATGGAGAGIGGSRGAAPLRKVASARYDGTAVTLLQAVVLVGSVDGRQCAVAWYHPHLSLPCAALSWQSDSGSGVRTTNWLQLGGACYCKSRSVVMGSREASQPAHYPVQRDRSQLTPEVQLPCVPLVLCSHW